MENYILGPTAINTFPVPGSFCFLAFLHKLTLLIHAHRNLEITKLSFTYPPPRFIKYMLYVMYSARNNNWLPLPPFLLAPIPSPNIYLSFISLHKKTGLPGLSPELGIPQSSKIGYNPSYQERTKQPNKRKMVPREDKESETCTHSYW